ncbi:hypothetical protein [Dokdonella koreensis]|uniref:hypothetical protein n=1 Tax=Dokdonella koreensis TaxID=323415 RepID=UPI0012376146|nr:hypothetical protein [Dokdonella koreensis]
MKRALLAALVMAGLPMAAFAQTCETPTSLHPQVPNRTLTGTTCGGQSGIPLGGAVAAHPSVVYQFTYNNSETGPITVTGAEREIVVAASCSSPPMGGGAPGVPLNIQSMGLQNGTNYLLIVTSDSGLPTTTPPRCGDFSVTYTALPVSLQSFSVE